MFDHTDIIPPEEFTRLTDRFGSPHREHVRMIVNANFFMPWENKFRSRRGEVMFLLPRPGGLLVHRKAHYPANAWRLLTGGIEFDETVESALVREPREEVGFAPTVKRFVALLTYDIVHAGTSYSFGTFIFLMDYSRQPLRPDDDEIEETRMVALDALPDVANTLRTLDPKWQSWGTFRAYAHDVVADLVTPDEIEPR